VAWVRSPCLLPIRGECRGRAHEGSKHAARVSRARGPVSSTVRRRSPRKIASARAAHMARPPTPITPGVFFSAALTAVAAAPPAPPGVDPAHHKVRSASVVLPPDQAFKDAAKEALTSRPGVAQTTASISLRSRSWR